MEPGPLAVAPAFSHFNIEGASLQEFSSKQSAKRAVEKLLCAYKPEQDHDHRECLETLSQDRQLRTLYQFLNTHQAQLTDAHSAAAKQLKQIASAELFRQVKGLAILGHQPREDDELDELLESLTGDGTMIGTDSFSINRDEALRKLADYQLSDSVLFPLFLAVGLTLLGARRLSMTIDSDEVWVTFEGAHLDPNVLEDAPLYLLKPCLDEESFAIQSLARALMQGAKSRSAEMHLKVGDTVTDLMEFPHFSGSVSGLSKKGTDGTFYCRRKFGLDVAKRYLKSLQTSHEEIPDLAWTLRYLPIPWALNEESFAGGIEILEGEIAILWENPDRPAPDFSSAEAIIRLPSPLPITVLCRLHPHWPAGLTTVLNCYAVEAPAIEVVPTTHLVLWLPTVATDLSGRNLVSNQFLTECLQSLSDFESLAWTTLAQMFPSLPAATQSDWVGPLLKLLAGESSVREILVDLPFLPVACEAPTSPRQWRQRAQRSHVEATAPCRHPLKSGESVISVSPEWLADYSLAFPDSREATEAVRRSERFYEKKAQWLESPVIPTELLNCPQRLSLELPRDLGFMGLSPQKRPPGRWLHQGRELPYNLHHFVPPYVEVVIHDDEAFMDIDWLILEPFEYVRSVQDLLQRKLPHLIDRLTDEDLKIAIHQEQLLQCLAWLSHRGTSISAWSERPFLKEHPDRLPTLLQDLVEKREAYGAQSEAQT